MEDSCSDAHTDPADLPKVGSRSVSGESDARVLSIKNKFIPIWYQTASRPVFYRVIMKCTLS